MKQPQVIAFQGAHGAFSDLACRSVFPDLTTLPCETFDDAFQTVQDGRAGLAMIPVDNTIAGRVADVHHLLPRSGLFVVGEHFQPVRHALLGLPGSKKDGLRHVHSHVHALPQCRKLIQQLGLKAVVHADTAGAARDVAERGDPAHAAIASTLAAQIYGLDVLQEDIQDAAHNTTRFLILSPQAQIPPQESGAHILTSLVFEVRNIPAALYKSLGGFATNGLSLAKLESYVDEKFQAAQFYCEVEGHPESRAYRLALEELTFFAKNIRFLGAFPAHAMRKTYGAQ